MGTPDESGHSRSLEVELKFDVDDDTLLPDLSGLPGVAAIGQAEVRELDAQYFDTADLDLAHAGYALRRRSGGPDAGWHVKGPKVDGARLELHWPLSDDMPEAVLTAVREVTDAELTPLARIRNRRIAHNLYSADGGVVAEFLDDHVMATDERSGTERTWREWEFELGPAAPDDDADRQALFTRFEKAVHAAGGRAAASDSKLARTLGQ
jgi:inorganic triphosphatase YgiF